MSTVPCFRIFCDDCEIEVATVTFPTDREARQWLQRIGGNRIRRNGEWVDLCPLCNEKRTSRLKAVP